MNKNTLEQILEIVHANVEAGDLTELERLLANLNEDTLVKILQDLL